MGAFTSREGRSLGSVKLEAQKIKEFSGSYEDWQKWKSRTECAFSGSGYEKILESHSYSNARPRMNTVVYSQLAAATVDGVAYHLVRKYELTKDGNAAWANLCEWYDGDVIQSETAENLRVKLENLRLHSGVSGSEYINKFLAWFRDLDKVPGEGYTKSHGVYLFLKNITDVDYQTTITFCRNTNATLDGCVAAIRKQERDLQQKRIAKRQLSTTIRQMKAGGELSDDETEGTPKKRQKNSKVRKVESSYENRQITQNSKEN